MSLVITDREGLAREKDKSEYLPLAIKKPPTGLWVRLNRILLRRVADVIYIIQIIFIR